MNDENALYENKYQHLLEYYNHISEKSNRLRHRIYHVKKEINHLKQLKKLLCERLLLHRAVIIDKNLEIPDNDSTMMDKSNIGELINSEQQQKADPPGNSRKRKQKVGNNTEDQAKKPIPNKRRKAKDDSSKGGSAIVSIIESININNNNQTVNKEEEGNQLETKNSDPLIGTTINQMCDDRIMNEEIGGGINDRNEENNHQNCIVDKN